MRKLFIITGSFFISLATSSASWAQTPSSTTENNPQFIKHFNVKADELIVYTDDQAKHVIKLSEDEANHIGQAGHINMKALNKKLSQYKFQWPVEKKSTATNND